MTFISVCGNCCEPLTEEGFLVKETETTFGEWCRKCAESREEIPASYSKKEGEDDS